MKPKHDFEQSSLAVFPQLAFMREIPQLLYVLLLLWLGTPHLVSAQADTLPPIPTQDGSQFGIRFSYQLQFPSKNLVAAQVFTLLEAGHHIGYGAYANVKIGQAAQFSPYFGLEHVFWPKSQSYAQACDVDSFPTFMAVDDSLPGRDFRFFNLAFEPAFKFYSRRMQIWLKFQPMFAYNIQRKVEQYNHTCGVPISDQFVDYTKTSLRGMSPFTFSLGAGIVKEVRFKNGSGLALEPGAKIMLSRLLFVKELQANGRSFDLYPAGFYLNLSFFK
jgi:hypothetical protein